MNNYSQHIGQHDPLVVLHETAREIAALIAPLSPAQLNHAPAPGKWSIREIIAHLADCEVVFGYRLRQTLAPQPGQPQHVIQLFEQDDWARQYGAYDVASALALFQAMRAWNIALIDHVGKTTPADLDRPLTHPERGPLVFRNIVETIAGHTLHHIPQIKALATS